MEAVATAEVNELITEEGIGYEVLSGLAQGVLPRIAVPHFVKPDGLEGRKRKSVVFLTFYSANCGSVSSYQYTGSISVMSLGHTVKGA